MAFGSGNQMGWIFLDCGGGEAGKVENEITLESFGEGRDCGGEESGVDEFYQVTWGSDIGCCGDFVGHRFLLLDMPEVVCRRVACTVEDLLAIEGDCAFVLVKWGNTTSITEDGNGYEGNIAKVWEQGHYGGCGWKSWDDQVGCVCGS